MLSRACSPRSPALAPHLPFKPSQNIRRSQYYEQTATALTDVLELIDEIYEK